MNEQLATLQEMILAAKADGDDETAGWLASIADDPEQLAAVTGADRTESDATDDPLARALLEHGFTGTITDKAGAKRHYQDGKQVAAPPEDAGAGGANAHTAPADADAAAQTKATTLAARIKEVPWKVVNRVTTWVKAKHEKLVAKYGKNGARAVMAGMVLLAPTPIPGSSLIPIALAEGVLRVRRAVAGTRTEAAEGAEANLSAEDVERIAKQLLAELEAEMGK